MLKIRLTRCGKKKKPTYRIIVANAQSPRDGKFLELIGHYNPFAQTNNNDADYNEMSDANKQASQKFSINIERLSYWLGVGAQPTDRIKLFISKMEDAKIAKFSEKFKNELVQRQAAAAANPPKEKSKKKK